MYAQNKDQKDLQGNASSSYFRWQDYSASHFLLQLPYFSDFYNDYNDYILFFIFKNICLFTFQIFGCFGSQLQHTGSSMRHGDLSLWCVGFSLGVARRLSSCGVRVPERVGSRARGLCSCGTQALQLWLACSVVVAHGLSCPAACGILVSRQGIEPASPTLEGGFLTTGPPGKSPCCFIIRPKSIKSCF